MESYRHRAGTLWDALWEDMHEGLAALKLFRPAENASGHVVIATAINIVQLMSWVRGEAPDQTRTSPFKKVMKLAALDGLFDLPSSVLLVINPGCDEKMQPAYVQLEDLLDIGAAIS